MNPGKSRPREWSPERLSQWRALRAQGKRHFIWAYGVLRWGGFMFFFSMGVFNYTHFGQLFSSEGHWGMRIVVALLTWMFVGYGYGHSQWRRNEQIYQAQMSDVRSGADFEA